MSTEEPKKWAWSDDHTHKREEGEKQFLSCSGFSSLINEIHDREGSNAAGQYIAHDIRIYTGLR